MGTIVRRLDANHDMTFGRGMRNIATTAEAVAQRLRCRLLTIRGEWFLDTDAGVPWFQPDDSDVYPIMGRVQNVQYNEAVLKSTILETDGVQTLDSFSMVFDHQTRKLRVTAAGKDVYGDDYNIVEVGP